MKNTNYQFGNSQSIIENLVDERTFDNKILSAVKVLALTIGFGFAYSLPVVCIRETEVAVTRNEWVRREEETPEEEAERKEQTRKDRRAFVQQYFKDHPIHN